MCTIPIRKWLARLLSLTGIGAERWGGERVSARPRPSSAGAVNARHLYHHQNNPVCRRLWEKPANIYLASDSGTALMSRLLPPVNFPEKQYKLYLTEKQPVRELPQPATCQTRKTMTPHILSASITVKQNLAVQFWVKYLQIKSNGEVSQDPNISGREEREKKSHTWMIKNE